MANPWKKGCSEFHWRQEAMRAAQEAGVCPIKVMAGTQTAPVVGARWEAWRRLSARGFSYASIGRASGFDHTSVRYACIVLHKPRGMAGRWYKNTPAKAA